MIYAIALQLADALKAQGVPYPVVFGPEQATDLYVAEDRIVVEYDDDGDSFEAPLATHPNPKSPLRCWQGVKVLIYARSNIANAAWQDHTRLANQVRDHVVAELDFIVRARKNFVRYRSGKFVTPIDAEGTTIFAGAVYELKLSIDRGIERRTWAGEKRPEVTVGPGGVAITSTTKVSSKLGPAGTAPPEAETAC